MSGFLLDANVLSEFNRRGEPDQRVKQWLEAADSGSLYISVLTFGEVRLGIELLPASKRRTQLEQWLERDLHDWFEGRILPVDESIANRWGAATALQHNLTIVSRNVSDFSVVGLAVVNPWQS